MKPPIFTIILLLIYNITFAQDTIKAKGYIVYNDKYAKDQSIFTTSRKITTVFGNSRMFISYITNFIRDVNEFANATDKLTNDFSNENHESSLRSAISDNELNAKRITISYIINTKTLIRNTINYFYYIKQNNCYTIDTLKKLEYFYQDSASKLILGYNCKKIILKTSKASYDIWYAEDLPFNVGPLAFFGAPGAILEVDAPSIKVGYVATVIETKNLSNLLIKTIPFSHDRLFVTKEGYLKLLQKNNNARATIH